MKVNVGKIDMALRLVFAAVLLYVGFMDNSIVSEGLSKTLIGFFALVPLATATFRICPLYSMIGVSTCSINKRKMMDQ